jgi:hypothetical protein
VRGVPPPKMLQFKSSSNFIKLKYYEKIKIYRSQITGTLKSYEAEKSVQDICRELVSLTGAVAFPA